MWSSGLGWAALLALLNFKRGLLLRLSCLQCLYEIHGKPVHSGLHSSMTTSRTPWNHPDPRPPDPLWNPCGPPRPPPPRLHCGWW